MNDPDPTQLSADEPNHNDASSNNDEFSNNGESSNSENTVAESSDFSDFANTATTKPEKSDSTHAVEQEKKPTPFWKDLPVLIVVALVLTFLLKTFIGQVFLIPSGSMEKTLHGCEGCTGDRIVVEKISYRFGEPKPGDVVVFRGPPSWDSTYVSIRSTNSLVRTLQNIGSFIGVVPPDENDLVKRVIAVGGQTVSCCDAEGRVQVNGKALDEPYIFDDYPWINGVDKCRPIVTSQRCFGPVTVPNGNLWVMGDHRGDSADSRFHMGDEYQGSVPVDNVIGKARFIILPLSRIGTIHSPNIQED